MFIVLAQRIHQVRNFVRYLAGEQLPHGAGCLIITLKLAVTRRRGSTLPYSILSWLWAVSSVYLLVARCEQRRFVFTALRTFSLGTVNSDEENHFRYFNRYPLRGVSYEVFAFL